MVWTPSFTLLINKWVCLDWITYWLICIFVRIFSAFFADLGCVVYLMQSSGKGVVCLNWVIWIIKLNLSVWRAFYICFTYKSIYWPQMFCCAFHKKALFQSYFIDRFGSTFLKGCVVCFRLDYQRMKWLFVSQPNTR